MTAYLGALTTTWTPSSTSECFSSFFYGSNSLGSWLQLGTTSTELCLPPNWNRDVSYFFSPGVCPYGYTYACTKQSTSSGEDMTVATCCPPGYYCMGELETSQIFACVSSFPSAGTYTVSSYWFVSPFDEGTTTISVSSGETVRGYGAIVRRATDDPSWTNVIPTSTTTVSPGSSATAGTASATAGGSDSGGSSSDGGLSTGAKAGIGVGVGVGVLLIAAACIGGFMIGKRASRKSAEAEAEKRRLGGELAGAPVQELSAAQTRHELQPAYISELEGTQRK